MDQAVEDLLYEWALAHHPDVLQDSELFDRLLRFIHAVLVAAVREERAATARRLLTHSRS